MSEAKGGEFYILSDPVEFSGQLVTELKFRSTIKARDMRGLPMREMLWDDMITIAGRLCGQPDAFMGEVSLRDMQSIAVLVSSFLSGGPTTGEKP